MHQKSDKNLDVISVITSTDITEGQVGSKKDELGCWFWINNWAKKHIEEWGNPKVATIVSMSWYLISGLIVDPLFLYIPIIDDKRKCLGMDKKLSIAAVTLRSLADVPFFLALIVITCEKISSGFKSHFKPDPDWLRRPRLIPAKAIPFLLPITHLIAFAKALVAVLRLFNVAHVLLFCSLLPIPQVAIVVFYFRMTSSGYFYEIAIVDVFLVIQYWPKIVISLAFYRKRLRLTRKWVKGSFSLALYICSSHVLGAFWYFSSIQRQIVCWHQACRNTPGCTSTYYCNDNSTNIGILNELCPINPENATVFNFGIFLDAFQSGTTGHINFPTKLFYCIWWAIRNLSNFGTNLEPSTNILDSGYAIKISIIGLLLFLFFIGNVQTYIQLERTKGEEINELQSKLRKKKLMIELWMERHNLPLDIRKELLKEQISRENLKENIDVDVDVKGQLSILSRSKKDLTVILYLCMDTLKRVPWLRNRDVQVLEKICEHLKPVVYSENSYIVRAGKPLDLMLLIIDGTIWTYKTSDDNAGKTKMGPSSMMMIKWLEKGDFYGEELLKCHSFSHLPISAENVRCKTKVEAFALRARDLRGIVSEPWWDLSNHNNSQQLEIDQSQNEVSKWEIVRSRVRTPPPLHLMRPI